MTSAPILEPAKMGPPEAPALGRPLDTASRTFPVPATPDLLAHLANPARWTPLDAPVIGAIALQLLCFALRLPRPFFLLSFLIWRLCYNAGLGAILHGQSRDGAFTRLFSALGFSLSPRDLDASTELPEWRKSLVRFFNRELVNHLNEVEDAPPPPPISDLAPEFKSWMAFRFLVDTILLNDFFAYLIMALSYFTWPAWDLMDFGRILAGAMLIWFNVWVKLDAHRVVKDYAWYWGVCIAPDDPRNEARTGAHSTFEISERMKIALRA